MGIDWILSFLVDYFPLEMALKMTVNFEADAIILMKRIVKTDTFFVSNDVNWWTVRNNIKNIDFIDAEGAVSDFSVPSGTEHNWKNNVLNNEE